MHGTDNETKCNSKILNKKEVWEVWRGKKLDRNDKKYI